MVIKTDKMEKVWLKLSMLFCLLLICCSPKKHNNNEDLIQFLNLNDLKITFGFYQENFKKYDNKLIFFDYKSQAIGVLDLNTGFEKIFKVGSGLTDIALFKENLIFPFLGKEIKTISLKDSLEKNIADNHLYATSVDTYDSFFLVKSIQGIFIYNKFFDQEFSDTYNCGLSISIIDYKINNELLITNGINIENFTPDCSNSSILKIIKMPSLTIKSHIILEGKALNNNSIDINKSFVICKTASKLYFIDIDSNQIKWKKDIEGIYQCRLFNNNSFVFNNYEVSCYSTSGDKLWELNYDKPVGFTFIKDKVLMVSRDDVTIVNSTSGKVLQTFKDKDIRIKNVLNNDSLIVINNQLYKI